VRFIKYSITAQFLFLPFAIFFSGILIGALFLFGEVSFLEMVIGEGIQVNTEDVRTIFIRAGWIIAIGFTLLETMRGREISIPFLHIGTGAAFLSMVGYVFASGIPQEMWFIGIIVGVHVVGLLSLALYSFLLKVFGKIESSIVKTNDPHVCDE